MSNVLSVFKEIYTKFFVLVSLVGVLLLSNLLFPPVSYAAPPASKTNGLSEEIVQPLELTHPAESREEAYEEVAKLAENPKELIKAQNKEEKAQEKAVDE
jgi:hypothetical protein